MKKDIRTFRSADGHHIINSYYYRDEEKKTKAVIQLCHGMAEYIERYEDMIEWYVKRGYAVAGNDHLGHGRSVQDGEYGFFAEKDGWKYVLHDMREMNKGIKAEWPDKPVILYGHSMGSFFARLYAEVWPDTISALIASGTAGPAPINGIGKNLASVISSIKGPHHVSKTLIKANTGHYLDKIENPVNEDAWLTRDDEVCKKYYNDPLCGFPFTASAYRDMITVLCKVNEKKWFTDLNKTLPVLLVAGGMDPVGNYGEGVRKVFSELISAGQQDVTCQIWPDDRHEIHNELDKEEVFEYIDDWISDRLDRSEGNLEESPERGSLEESLEEEQKSSEEA